MDTSGRELSEGNSETTVLFKLLRNQGKKIMFSRTSDDRLELPPTQSVKRAMNHHI